MKQLTLWPQPERQAQTDPATLRAIRRAKLAFMRLVRLFEAPDQSKTVPIPEWLVYVARRCDNVLGEIRNDVDPLRRLRVQARRVKRKMPPDRRKKIVALLNDGHEVPRCAYCGKLIKDDLTLDHVEPASRGGNHKPQNIVPACLPCNGVKGDRTPEEWANDILSARAKTAEVVQLQR